MLRRFFSPRHASQLTARRPWSIYRNASIKTAFEYASTPVLARYPVAYTIVQSLKYGLGFVLAAHVFVDYFYAISLTYGISMVPTFAPSGDVVLISKYYRHGRDVQVGDVVSFKHPLREDIRACKRVIGMPGDFVLRDTPGRGRDMMIQVPEGHCWVVGDNLNHSRDSRMFGPLPLALINGKVVAVYQGSITSLSAVPGGLVDAQTV